MCMGTKKCFDASVNEALYCARVSCNLSQEALAKMAFMSRTYYVTLENGKCDASINTWRRIAKALGVRDFRKLLPK